MIRLLELQMSKGKRHNDCHVVVPICFDNNCDKELGPQTFVLFGPLCKET